MSISLLLSGRTPPSSTLFPYTTLFRSVVKEGEYVLARYPNGTIQWGFANTSPGWQFIDTGYVAPLNQWTHIAVTRSEEQTTELQSRSQLVSRNLPESINDAITGQNDFR